MSILNITEETYNHSEYDDFIINGVDCFATKEEAPELYTYVKGDSVSWEQLLTFLLFIYEATNEN